MNNYFKTVYYIDGFTMKCKDIPYDYISFHINKGFRDWQDIVRKEVFENDFETGIFAHGEKGNQVQSMLVSKRPILYKRYSEVELVKRYLLVDSKDKFKRFQTNNSFVYDPSSGLLDFSDEVIEKIKTVNTELMEELAMAFLYGTTSCVKSIYQKVTKQKGSYKFPNHGGDYLSENTKHELVQYLIKKKIKLHETN